MFEIQAAAICSKGKIRHNNEDNLIFQMQILEEEHDEIIGEWKHSPISTITPVLYGVFDGMGGHSKGEYASYVTANVAKEKIEKADPYSQLIEEILVDICMTSNDIVCKKKEEEKIIVGTTASMICFFQDSVYSCNLGDSPIYRFRDGELKEFYKEHTERRFREMIFGKESVKGKKFPLTQHVGINPEEMRIVPYLMNEELKRGDIYLVCSDGLTDMVSEEEISNIIAEDTDKISKIHKLENRAMENGGKDNITIVYVEII